MTKRYLTPAIALAVLTLGSAQASPPAITIPSANAAPAQETRYPASAPAQRPTPAPAPAAAGQGTDVKDQLAALTAAQLQLQQQFDRQRQDLQQSEAANSRAIQESIAAAKAQQQQFTASITAESAKVLDLETQTSKQAAEVRTALASLPMLQAQIAKQVSDLTASIDRVQAQMLAQINQAGRDTQASVKAQIDDAQSRYKATQDSALAAQRQQQATVDAKLAAIDNQVSQITSEQGAEHARGEALQTAANLTATQAAAVRADIDKLHTSIDANGLQLATLDKRVLAQLDDEATSHQQTAALRTQIDQMASHADLMNTAVAALQKSQSGDDSQSVKIASLESQLSKQIAEQTAAQQQVATLTTQIQQIASKADQASALATSSPTALQASFDRLSADNASLKKQMSDLNTIVSDQAKQVAVGNTVQLQSRIDALEKERTDAGSRMDHAVADLTRQVTESQQSLGTLTTRVESSLIAKPATAPADGDQFQAQVRNIQTEQARMIQALEAKVDRLQAPSADPLLTPAVATARVRSATTTSSLTHVTFDCAAMSGDNEDMWGLAVTKAYPGFHLVSLDPTAAVAWVSQEGGSATATPMKEIEKRAGCGA